MSTEQSAIKLDVRVYPIPEPKGSIAAFASVTINDLVAINGIRVIEGANGPFTAMPQAKDNKGDYRDIAFPVTKELRQQLNKTILDEYAVQKTSVKAQIKENAKDVPARNAAEGKSTREPGPEL